MLHYSNVTDFVAATLLFAWKQRHAYLRNAFQQKNQHVLCLGSEKLSDLSYFSRYVTLTHACKYERKIFLATVSFSLLTTKPTYQSMNQLPSYNPLKIPNQIRLQSSGLSNPCHFKKNFSSTSQPKGRQRTRGAYRQTVWILIWWWPPCLGDHRTPPPPPPPWSPASSPRGSSSGGSTSRLETATCAPVLLEKNGTNIALCDTGGNTWQHKCCEIVDPHWKQCGSGFYDFISMRIRARCQGAKPMRIRLCSHKNVNF